MIPVPDVNNLNEVEAEIHQIINEIKSVTKINTVVNTSEAVLIIFPTIQAKNRARKLALAICYSQNKREVNHLMNEMIRKVDEHRNNKLLCSA